MTSACRYDVEFVGEDGLGTDLLTVSHAIGLVI